MDRKETDRRREDDAVDLFRHVGAFDAVTATIARHARAFGVSVAAIAVLYLSYAAAGYRAAPIVAGSIVEPSLGAPVLVRRDDRFVAHITAASEHDAFFAQGFVEGTDRLFQMDMTRRYALGTLSEVLGPKSLGLDEMQRYYDVRDIAEREWRGAGPRERTALAAFSDGVNAAIRVQPLPVEFRMLLYRPRPWRPQDSLAVSLAVSIALADSWRDVLSRDDIWRRVGAGGFDDYLPLSDPRYDVSADGRPNVRPAPAAGGPRIASLPHLAAHPRAGSNAWAAGAARTASGRALLANDPHLDLTIPGLWYLLDVRAPGFHAAGASIPGAPGVLLGHNERLAWGATNADAAAMTAFAPGRLRPRNWEREIFHVRNGKDVARAYYRTAREFAVPYAGDRQELALIRWRPFDRLRPPAGALATFLALDRATDVRDALRVLSGYQGTAENFVLADTRGTVAYHLAGSVPADRAWGRYVESAADLRAPAHTIAFGRLPALRPARDGIVVSANNRMYPRTYPYRLAAAFDPPYRAYRIAQLLHARSRYDVAYFAAMQLDTVSPADLELARGIAPRARELGEPVDVALGRDLLAWNGAFAPGSRTATTVHALRLDLEAGQPSFYALLRRLRARSPGLDADIRLAFFDARNRWPRWGSAGSVPVEHPLAPLPFGLLDGPTLPGDGDEYTIHLQQDGFSQSFRAVWNVGDWDAGGIAIPSGESGEPGSGHYTDLAPAWIAGRLAPLPFGDRAIEAATRERLTLVP